MRIFGEIPKSDKTFNSSACFTLKMCAKTHNYVYKLDMTPQRGFRRVCDGAVNLELGKCFFRV